MKNVNFDHKVFSGMEIPLQKLMELNIKTIQGMSYFKTSELMNLKKPEDLFVRNMNVLIQNSQMALNYMKDTFSILESHWFDLSRQTEESAEKVMHHASSAAKKTLQTGSSTMKSAVKKLASTAKKASSSTKAKTAAKKTASKVVAKSAAKSTAAKKVASKSAAKPTAKVAAKKASAAKPVAKKSVAKPKAALKAGSKAKSSVKKVAKPAVKHHMPASHSHSVKPEVRVLADKPHSHSKDMGHHNVPKVGSMQEKSGSGIKDLGLLNKGPNFHN
jgi:hypothetical protein